MALAQRGRITPDAAQAKYLALLIGKQVHFTDIERLAFENGRQLLRKVKKVWR